MRNDEAVNVKIASNGEDIVDNGVDIVSVVSSDSQGGTDDEAAVSREDSDVDDDDWEYEDAIGTDDDDEEEEEETSGAGELSDDEMSKSTISLPLRDPSEVGEGESDDESDDETWDYETDTSETDDDNEEEDLTLPAIIHELSVDDTLQAPAWRMVDQHESLSDCTVHVDKVDGTRHQTYHVHTYALAFGACRSEYFATLFRSQQFQEHASRTSNILLHDAAAHAFPDFLDFLYGGTIEVKERPVALYHLADFFRVRALMEVIEEIVLQRISVHSNVESACRFYREALTFDPPVQAFIDCIEQVCVKEILQIEPSSPILEVLGPESFVAIARDESFLCMTEAEPTYGIHHVLIPMKILKNKSDVSARLSRLVVSYCQIHEMDAESFDLLTSDDMLPTIAFDAAPKLIQLKESLVAATPDNESDLEKRCFAAIEAIVDKINFDDPSDPTLQFMRTRPAKRIMETMSALGLAQQKELTRVRDDNIVSI